MAATTAGTPVAAPPKFHLVVPKFNELGYKIVDSRHPKQPRPKKRLPPKPSTQVFQQKQQMDKAELFKQQKQEQRAKRGMHQKQQRQFQQQRQQQRQRRPQKMFAEWSIEPQSSWTLEQDIALPSLPKQAIDGKKVEYTDLHWRGVLRWYDKRHDKVVPKQPVPVQHLNQDAIEFYFTSTREDSEIGAEWTAKPEAQIAATDQIIACLMAAAQSKYSWHVKLMKVTSDGVAKVLFDKPPDSLDYVTVRETAYEPPLVEDEIVINRPRDLAVEASTINLHISQQLLLRNEHGEDKIAAKFDRPVFWDADQTTTKQPADKAYRYRRIKIPGRDKHQDENCRKPITLITRADVDARLQGGPESKDNYVAIKALNEYRPAGTGWKYSQLETQKGALIATEIGANSAKFARWVAQAIIAGCDTMKIVYVARVNDLDSQKHQILSVQTFNTLELGTQIGLTPDSGWGSVRAILDMVLSKDDGNFLLIRDPVKSVLKLYRMPAEEDDDGAEDA
eukprot:Selendium_serpulae@DN5861_c0_g1_i1.p1